MKNYNVVISLKKKLNKLVAKKGLTNKCVIKLSQKLDKLQNKLYYQM